MTKKYGFLLAFLALAIIVIVFFLLNTHFYSVPLREDGRVGDSEYFCSGIDFDSRLPNSNPAQIRVCIGSLVAID